jgi:uncharacterized protein
MDEDLSELWALAVRNFCLQPESLHGPDHWQRVERNGLKIARESGADVLLVRLFAVLHDSRRMNETYDPDHGARAADWATELNGVQFNLSPERLSLLRAALIDHDRGKTCPAWASCRCHGS